MDQISALLGKVCSWHVQTNGVQGQPRGVHGRSRFILILFEGSVSFRRRMRGFRGWRESFEFKEPQHYSWLYSDDPKMFEKNFQNVIKISLAGPRSPPKFQEYFLKFTSIWLDFIRRGFLAQGCAHGCEIYSIGFFDKNKWLLTPWSLSYL